MRALPHALERWTEITARLAGRPFALFLDYDGTLAPIAACPEEARLPEPTREVLRRLAARVPVAILSGRARADVEALVGLTGIAYAGSHGFDLSGPDGDPLSLPSEAGAGDHLPELIDRASTDLARLLAGQAGVRLEPKGTALAVHYRQADPAQLPAIEAAVDTVPPPTPSCARPPARKSSSSAQSSTGTRAEPSSICWRGSTQTPSPSTSATTRPTKTPSAPSPTPASASSSHRSRAPPQPTTA